MILMYFLASHAIICNFTFLIDIHRYGQVLDMFGDRTEMGKACAATGRGYSCFLEDIRNTESMWKNLKMVVEREVSRISYHE